MSRYIYVEVKCDLCGKERTIGPPTIPHLDLQYVDGVLWEGGWAKVGDKDICLECAEAIKTREPQ